MNEQTIHNAEKQDLVFKRVFEAPVEKVWQAWVDPELVKQWWGPDGFTAPVAEIDLQVGGTSLLCMSAPEFGEHYSTWRYVDIRPLERIEYIHNLADARGNAIDPASVGMPPEFPREQRHVVQFRALDGKRTELTVTEYGWTPGQMMEYSRMGMEQCLEKMAKIV